MATDRCGCSFSTLPGKELVCAEPAGHRGAHQADGVTWTQLFPDPPSRLIGYRTADGQAWHPADVELVYEAADIEGNPLPDEDEQAPLSDFQPPDLDQAIQAAANALHSYPAFMDATTLPEVLARIAVEAAAPHLHGDLRQLRAARAELAVLRHSTDQMRDLTREQDQTITDLRQRLATLQMHAAELRDALAELFDLLHTLTLSPRERASINVREPAVIEARVRAALIAYDQDTTRDGDP